MPGNQGMFLSRAGKFSAMLGKVMNWTSTQNTFWADQCRAFATERAPFRLDHVFGPAETGFCDAFCKEYLYRQRKQGSSVAFTPEPD